MTKDDGLTFTVTTSDATSTIPDGSVVTYVDWSPADGTVIGGTKAADSEPDADPDDPCIAEHMKKMAASGMSDADARKKAEAMCAEGDSEKPMKELGKEAEDRIVTRVIKALADVNNRVRGRKEPVPEIGGFKVFTDANGKDRWMAWYSNNFEDREKEFFREKGFDRYVKRLDMGLVDMPEYWTWHTRGTKAGVADWVDRIGHFHVATGLYDDTPLAQATKAYDIAHQKEYGVSHGFLYRQSDIEMVDGKRVYKDWNTFEISTLPLHRAANELTAFAVEQSEGMKETKMDAEKRKLLAEKYAALGGEAYVEKLEAETEKRGKDIEALKGYKDFVHPDADDNGEAVANKEALENADKAFGELMPQLMEDAGEAVSAALQSVKAVKAMQTDNTQLRKLVKSLQDEVAAIRDGAPRASQSAKTLIKEDDKLATKSQLGMTPEQEALSEALPGLYKNG